jgi:hypothetical protein
MTNRSLTSTIGSIFGAIGTTADAASKTVSVAATGIDILAYHADAWRESAKVSTHYDKKTHEVIAKSRAAQKITNHRSEILSLCRDETYAELYMKAMEELSIEEEKPSEE